MRSLHLFQNCPRQDRQQSLCCPGLHILLKLANEIKIIRGNGAADCRLEAQLLELNVLAAWCALCLL